MPLVHLPNPLVFVRFQTFENEDLTKILNGCNFIDLNSK
jgi:hypothetical protein